MVGELSKSVCLIIRKSWERFLPFKPSVSINIIFITIFRINLQKTLTEVSVVTNEERSRNIRLVMSKCESRGNIELSLSDQLTW